MGFVEEMKWWQWIVISLLAGAWAGYFNSEFDPTPDNKNVASQMTFEEAVLQRPGKNNPNAPKLIDHICVYPPKALRNDGSLAQLVTFTRVQKGKNGIGDQAVQCSMLAPFPFSPDGPRDADAIPDQPYPGMKIYTAARGDTIDSVVKSRFGAATKETRDAFLAANASLRNASPAQAAIVAGQSYYIPWTAADHKSICDFFDEANKLQTGGAGSYGWIHYHYAFWHEPGWSYAICIGGSFALIGVAWPLGIRFLLTGSLKSPGRKEVEYDLNRFGGQQEKKSAPVSMEMNAEAKARLQALEEQIAASLEAGESRDSTSALAAVAEKAPVKRLFGATDETKPTVPPRSEEGKSYDGEFYPVAHPKVMKKDEPTGMAR
jgi:hypothetical protein